MARWVPRSIITSRIGFTSGSRFKWAGRTPQADTRPRMRYACTGPCGIRFRSAEPVKYCRSCGWAVEGRGPV